MQCTVKFFIPAHSIVYIWLFVDSYQSLSNSWKTSHEAAQRNNNARWKKIVLLSSQIHQDLKVKKRSMSKNRFISSKWSLASVNSNIFALQFQAFFNHYAVGHKPEKLAKSRKILRFVENSSRGFLSRRFQISHKKFWMPDPILQPKFKKRCFKNSQFKMATRIFENEVFAS